MGEISNAMIPFLLPLYSLLFILFIISPLTTAYRRHIFFGVTFPSHFLKDPVYRTQLRRLFLSYALIFTFVALPLLTTWFLVFAWVPVVSTIPIYQMGNGLSLLSSMWLAYGQTNRRVHLWKRALGLPEEEKDYWAWGLNFNPLDGRACVPTRSGRGSTINCGHPYGIAATVLLGFGLLAVWLVWILSCARKVAS
eukprot:gnl/Trimastix_PCT/3999.p1 GENE.gnl/Trimastix_PCT/3999~~gnl/Trimastix_PCT/3999.p1  ORF type:complete len:195 (+),score=18.47 gnl/Trimastix_PCT/3999:94-678(+)